MKAKTRVKKKGVAEVDGTVVKVLPSTMFRVELDTGHVVLAHISGKLRKYFIKITVGDRVSMDMSPYNLDKARITYRHSKPRKIIQQGRRKR